MKQILLYLTLFCLSCIASETVHGQLTDLGKEKVSVEHLNLKTIKIFPNPALDHFKINLSKETVKYVTINTILGKEIKKVKSNSNESFDVSDLRLGVYIVRIFDHKDELIKAVRLSKV